MSSFVRASELEFSDFEKEELSIPSSGEKDFKSSKEQTIDSSKSYQLTPSFGILDGGYYIGGKKIPASFYNMNLSFKIISNPSFYYGAEFQYLFNKSKVNTQTGVAIVGKKWDQNSFFYGVEGGLGFSFYEETTEIQQGQASGLSTLLRGQVGKKINDQWSFIVNYSWIHYTYSDSFWGSDIFKDVAIDQMGLTIGLDFNF